MPCLEFRCNRYLAMKLETRIEFFFFAALCSTVTEPLCVIWCSGINIPWSQSARGLIDPNWLVFGELRQLALRWLKVQIFSLPSTIYISNAHVLKVLYEHNPFDCSPPDQKTVLKYITAAELAHFMCRAQKCCCTLKLSRRVHRVHKWSSKNDKININLPQQVVY